MTNTKFKLMLSGYFAVSKKLAGLATLFALSLAPFASVGTAQAAYFWPGPQPVFVTMNNSATANALVAYSPTGTLVGTFPTGGIGGASGNGGAVQVYNDMVFVPDFGSKDVAVFSRVPNGFKLVNKIPTASGPVSLALGQDHLYVLESSKVESFKLEDCEHTGVTADGSAAEIDGDGSAGQIGYLDGGAVIYTEKTGSVAEISTNFRGALTGGSVEVAGIPSGLNTPLGLATNDSRAVVTNAHGNAYQQMLIEGGKVIATALGPGTFSGGNADCWNAFFGQNLVYSANSPAKQIDLFISGHNTVALDKADVATLGGSPTDLSVSSSGLLGVIWGTNVSMFKISANGNLTLLGTAPTAGAMNGAAWID